MIILMPITIQTDDIMTIMGIVFIKTKFMVSFSTFNL